MRTQTLLANLTLPCCLAMACTAGGGDGVDTDGTDSSAGTASGPTSGNTDCTVGADGCDCRGDGTCDPGLVCLGQVCGTAGECGDGAIDAGEECDDGASNGDNAGCKTDCTMQACGDGSVGPGEACDDGNTQDGDECAANCALPGCGDMVVADGSILAEIDAVGPKEVAISLFGPYLVGVELAGMILLAGLVGAFHIGRPDARKKEEVT